MAKRTIKQFEGEDEEQAIIQEETTPEPEAEAIPATEAIIALTAPSTEDELASLYARRADLKAMKKDELAKHPGEYARVKARIAELEQR